MENLAGYEPPVSKLTIDDVPDELLLRILSYFSISELIEVTQHVCTRWKKLSHDPELWRDKELSFGHYISIDDMEKMLWKVPQLRKLEFSRGTWPKVLHALCDNCPHLTSLKFYDLQSITDSLVRKLVDSCPNIQTLRIPNEVLQDENSARAVAQLKLLQSLEICSFSKSYEPIHLRPIVDGCPQLTGLEMPKVNFSMDDLEYLVKIKGKKLTHLTLPWTTIDRRCVAPMLQKCTSLVYLELTSFVVLLLDMEEAFTPLGRLPTLRSLTMNRLPKVPPAALSLPFESGGLSHLQTLDLKDNTVLDERVMTAVCKGCPELKRLNLESCDITDECLRHLYLLRKLEILDLRWCRGLQGEAISHVAKLPNLRSLFLGGIDLRNLQPGLERILDMTSLEILNLNNLSNGNLFPFDRFAGRLVNLKVLNVPHDIMDDSELLRLQQQMPGLKVNCIHELRAVVRM